MDIAPKRWSSPVFGPEPTREHLFAVPTQLFGGQEDPLELFLTPFSALRSFKRPAGRGPRCWRPHVHSTKPLI